MLEWHYKTSPYPWGAFYTHAFHVAPSMGPIVEFTGSGETLSRKAYQSTKPGNGAVYVECTSVAIS